MAKRKPTKRGRTNPIAELRKKKGLTQMDLAVKIGAHSRLVQRWEIGEGKPSLAYLFKLAKTLGTRPESLAAALGLLDS